MAQLKVDDKDNAGIKITDAMIEAGIDRLRDFSIGEPISRIVKEVYLAIEIERLAQVSVADYGDMYESPDWVDYIRARDEILWRNYRRKKANHLSVGGVSDREVALETISSTSEVNASKTGKTFLEE